VTSAGLVADGVSGVRKQGTDVPVTVEDQWHLGSDTKAMTAMVIAALVEQGKLSWDTSIDQIFPGLSPPLPEALRQVTLTQLLSHRAGLPHDANWREVSRAGTLHQQRVAALQSMAAVPLLSAPGSAYAYSNLGYVIAAVMAEEVAHESWEALITRILFQPLKMTSAGFGGTGTPGKIDQPWPHRSDGAPTARNGPAVDNPPVMGPAGTVHCSIADWAKFVADQLRGLRGKPALLRPETYQKLHDPPFGGTYAFGWGVTRRPWGGGIVYTHSGSNTMNTAVVWMAPQRDFAVLICTNQAGPEAAKACDEVAGALIGLQTKR
jgi:CubicO group peptidase (beta-lactamase class C family)